MIEDMSRATREEVRGHILKAVDRNRPEATGAAIIRRGLEQIGIRLITEDLFPHLAYLKDKGLIESSDRGAYWLMTRFGVDVIEGTTERPDGIPSLSLLSYAEVKRRKEIRWRILNILDISRASGTLGQTMQLALSDVDFVVSDRELNREIAYLSACGYVAWSGDLLGLDWSAKLTTKGVDVANYDTDAPASLARPEQFWEG